MRTAFKILWIEILTLSGFEKEMIFSPVYSNETVIENKFL